MPQSWRINVKELDRSQTLIPEAGATGAMVMKSIRGPKTPVYVSSRQETRIIDLFGNPSSTYPDVWEAIEYNRDAPIWLASPHSDSDTLSGVVVTDAGTVALASDGPTVSGVDSYSFSSENEFFALFARSPSSTDNWGVQVSFNSTSKLFTVVVYYTEDDGDTWLEKETYTVSPTEGKKDGFGKNVYVENIFDGETNDFLIAKANPTSGHDDPTYEMTDDTTPTLLEGGSRSTPVAGDFTTVWNTFQKARQYSADIFMDNTTYSEVVNTFDTLRNSYQKYAYYIAPLPMSEDVTTAITTKKGYSIDNPGLAFYWNHGKVSDTYNGGSFWTSLIGRVGRKLALMDNIYNGGAPAWIDENNHGGQLGSGILELEYDPTEDELETLDESGVNAIVFDQNYGVLIASQRTGQSPGVLSDNSWIAHRRLFDYIIQNIVDQVLPFQLVKLNDESHRARVASQAESLIIPIQAEGLLNAFAVICDSSNNTDNILAQRKFILDVIVQVTPYSETIDLRFTNIGQTTNIEELVS